MNPEDSKLADQLDLQQVNENPNMLEEATGGEATGGEGTEQQKNTASSAVKTIAELPEHQEPSTSHDTSDTASTNTNNKSLIVLPHLAKEFDYQITSEDERYMEWVLRKEMEVNGNQLVSYFRFMINPESFEHTIKNMMCYANLVRDGKASLRKNSFHIPVIAPTTPLQKIENESVEKEKRQCIIPINKTDWKKLIDVLELTDCVMLKWKAEWDELNEEE